MKSTWAFAQTGTPGSNRQIRAARRTNILLLAAGLALAGCGREQISVYVAPKDGAPPQMAQDDAHAGLPGGEAVPEISLKLPAGWVEIAPDGVNFRCFQVTNSSGAVATAGIARLGNLSGQEGLLVNMWRSQAGQPPLGDADVAKLFQPIEFAGAKGSLYEATGTGANGPMGILVAFTHRADGSWFCKLSGNADLVAAQKPEFLDFVKSLEFKNSPAAPAPTMTVASAGGGQFRWAVPAGWKAQPAGQMQVAVFQVPEREGGKGEVSVSTFPTDTGGTLANVNRWRTKFMSLPAVEEKDLPQIVSKVDPSLPDSVLVDLKNDKRQLIGAIVHRGDTYWFYKFSGDAAAVGPEKDNFIAFAKSTPE